MPDGFGRSEKRKKERPDLTPYTEDGLKVSDHSCPKCGTPGWDAKIYPDGGRCDNGDCPVKLYNRETGEIVRELQSSGGN